MFKNRMQITHFVPPQVGGKGCELDRTVQRVDQ